MSGQQDLEPLRAIERRDLANNLGAGFVVLGIATFALVDFIRFPSVPFWAPPLIFTTYSVALALGVGVCTSALLPRPTRVRYGPDGVSFDFRRGQSKTFGWETFARVAEYRLVQGGPEVRVRRTGLKLRLRRPLPYSFWITSEGVDLVRSSAAQAGYVTQTRPLRTLLVTGWAEYGLAVTLLPQTS